MSATTCMPRASSSSTSASRSTAGSSTGIRSGTSAAAR
jgi:hypothetical protein